MASPASLRPSAPPAYSDLPPPYDDVPSKYIVSPSGVKKLNPAYKDYMAKQGRPVTTTDKTLLVVANKEEFEKLQSVYRAASQEPPRLAESTEATLEMVNEDPVISATVGLTPDAMLEDIGQVFAKYEIPMGMMNKLMLLSEYNGMEFIIDDSGSMGQQTDALNSRGQKQTRWEEAREGLETSLEILAHVPIAPITIRFLNRADKIVLDRKGESPAKFLEYARREIATVFERGPNGSTPILRCLEGSLKDGIGKKIVRYLFCDGVPDGEEEGVRRIKQLLIHRPNPVSNPFTLLSCSDKDHEVEWMKDVEEVAPFCTELDDFKDERDEVLKDQGDVFPYTKGFYLVCRIAAAMNPYDLDALDESAPMTKMTLDNLSGLENSEQEYRRYFDGFMEAQRKRSVKTEADRVRKEKNWEPHYAEFLNRPIAAEIEAVKQFKEQLHKLIMA